MYSTPYVFPHLFRLSDHWPCKSCVYIRVIGVLNASGFTVESTTLGLLCPEKLQASECWILLEQQLVINLHMSLLHHPQKARMHLKLLLVGLFEIQSCSDISHCYVLCSVQQFSTTSMNIYPQASNGAPDTSMGEVCTSVLFESSISRSGDCNHQSSGIEQEHRMTTLKNFAQQFSYFLSNFTYGSSLPPLGLLFIMKTLKDERYIVLKACKYIIITVFEIL